MRLSRFMFAFVAIRILPFVIGVPTAVVSAQSQTNFTLARGQVGQLKLGMTVDDIIALIGNTRVKRVDLQLEGMPTPALEIRLDGLVAARRRSMTAEIFPPSQNRIWRVTVFDRRFRTADGLGVGSTLGDIRAHHSVKMLLGEGGPVAHVEALQMSFAFGSRWYPSTRLPASARVSSVLVLLPPGDLPK
jgi:hypothetical protein